MINYLTRSTTEPTEPTEPVDPPIEEEEEDPFEDNTGNRDDILNAKPGDYNAWLDALNGMDVSAPTIPNIDFGDEEQIYARIPLVIDSTKLLYNTKNFRLEDLTMFGQNTYKKYKEEFDRLNTVFAQEIENENNDYNNKISSAITEEEKQQITEQHNKNLESINNNKRTQIRVLNDDYLQKSFEIGKQIAAVKNGESNETGFIGDVYIDGKLNNTPIEDYLKKGDNIQIRDVENLEEELNTKADECHGHDINIQKLQLNLADLIHTHPITDITNLQTELDKKAEKEHTHTAAEITDLQTELDKKANVVHEHTIEDITDLQTELDNKANITHNHTVTDITDLQTELDKVANKEHTHETINNDLAINGNLNAGTISARYLNVRTEAFKVYNDYTHLLFESYVGGINNDKIKMNHYGIELTNEASGGNTTMIKPDGITINDSKVLTYDDIANKIITSNVQVGDPMINTTITNSNIVFNCDGDMDGNRCEMNKSYIKLTNTPFGSGTTNTTQIQADGITINGKQVLTDEHTHKIEDITDLQNGFGTSSIYVDAGERNTINIGNTIDITYKDRPEYYAKITPDYIMFNSTGGSNTMIGAGSITVDGSEV